MAFSDISTRANGSKILASWFNAIKTAGQAADTAVTALTARFDIATGHDHDGTDAKKVLGTNIDSGASASGLLLAANGSGGSSWATAGLLAVTSKTTTYTALVTDDVILCSDAGGSWTLSLPTAVGNTGKVLTLAKTNSSTNAVTIDPSGAETIDGASTKTLNTQYEKYRIISDGANWAVLDHFCSTDWVSFTPTGTWLVNTTYTGKWRRSGDSMEVQVRVATSGAPTAAVLTIDLPSGYTVDTNKLTSTGSGEWSMHGSSATIRDQGIASFQARVIYQTTSTFRIVVGDDSGGGNLRDSSFVTSTAPMTWGASDYLQASLSVPISGWSA